MKYLRDYVLDWLRQGVESKPAPGDAGTDSGEDDDAKVAAVAADRPQATAAEEILPVSRRKTAAGSPPMPHT